MTTNTTAEDSSQAPPPAAEIAPSQTAAAEVSRAQAPAAEIAQPQTILERVVAMVATLKTLRAAVAAATAPAEEARSLRALEAAFSEAHEFGEALIKPWIEDLTAEARALAFPYYTEEHDVVSAAEGSLRVQLRSLGLQALQHGHAQYSRQERGRLVIAVLEDWISNRCQVKTTGD
jgi:hypothetical protein